MYENSRIRLFNVGFDPVGLAEASQRVLEWSRERKSRVVVTPNVDHLVKIAEEPELMPIYDQADLVLADGQPVIWASRMLGAPLPERVAGSDLFPQLLRDAQAVPGLRLFLFGGMDGVAERAARNIEAEFPWVRVVGMHAPPFGFETKADQNDRAVESVAAADADLVLLALGAPKQERWAHRERSRLRCGALLCLGATIDFMAKTIARAPSWMRRSGLEWVFRLAGEPKRLAGRYAKDAVIFPRLVIDEVARRARDGDAH
jgi:N-acetylglucosaminyldiphosphoundecaprenol N-acetyl-beta-D-mannosaminyltransferase